LIASPCNQAKRHHLELRDKNRKSLHRKVRRSGDLKLVTTGSPMCTEVVMNKQNNHFGHDFAIPGLAVVIVACGAASAVHAQNGQFPFPPIGYTSVSCECFFESCDAFCGTPNASHVTALVDTEGPNDWFPTWSPDAAAVAYASDNEIIVADLTGAVNITNTAATESFPSWSPDGRRIAFGSDRAGPFELFVMNPDGSDVERVAMPVALMGRPSWAPDSARLAFVCNVVPGNDDVCVVRSDGTGFLRLTDDPASDAYPAWSPDGAAIAFATTRYGTDYELALMNPDGSAVSRIGTGVPGTGPAWSPDGRQIAFDYFTNTYVEGNPWPAIFTMKADGSDIRLFAEAAMQPAWKPGLFVGFTVACSSLTCSFDGTSSVGDIVSYAWDLGDEMTASGSVVSHEFAAGGTHAIVLTVTDATGATATAWWPISVSRAPVASFTVSCDEALTCLFDWSSSYDPEGAALSMWLQFGDGGARVSLPGYSSTALRTYNSPGTYTATLEVSDGVDSTTASRTFAVPTPVMHIGDLDAMTTGEKNSRSALVRIAVHTSKHTPLGTALVSASWSDGTPASCITDLSGYCTIGRQYSTSKPIVSLSVIGVSKESYVYVPAANHDPNGDSNGTTIAISRR
jgi:PKD repeat protein